MPERWRLAQHPRAARIARLRARALAAVRRYLDSEGLVEADVPVLLPHAGQEPWLAPPRVDLPGMPGPLWLQTSPELSLKRLLCAGLPAVYALGPAFRGGREELGAWHQPAFAMLEWYRPGDDLELLATDCRRLGELVAQALDREPPPAGQVLTLAEACRRWAGVDLTPLLEGDRPAFARACRAAGLERCRDDDEGASLLGRVLVERVEPALAEVEGWVFLHGYPVDQAALAEVRSGAPPVALRMEAYLGGVELANGYVELRDGAEQRRRWDEEAALRDGDGPARDEGLLEALECNPPGPTVGMALGFDRLLMALTGAPSLADVLPLRLDRQDGP